MPMLSLRLSFRFINVGRYVGVVNVFFFITLYVYTPTIPIIITVHYGCVSLDKRIFPVPTSM